MVRPKVARARFVTALLFILNLFHTRMMPYIAGYAIIHSGNMCDWDFFMGSLLLNQNQHQCCCIDKNVLYAAIGIGNHTAYNSFGHCLFLV